MESIFTVHMLQTLLQHNLILENIGRGNYKFILALTGPARRHLEASGVPVENR